MTEVYEKNGIRLEFVKSGFGGHCNGFGPSDVYVDCFFTHQDTSLGLYLTGLAGVNKIGKNLDIPVPLDHTTIDSAVGDNGELFHVNVKINRITDESVEYKVSAELGNTGHYSQDPFSFGIEKCRSGLVIESCSEALADYLNTMLQVMSKEKRQNIVRKHGKGIHKRIFGR